MRLPHSGLPGATPARPRRLPRAPHKARGLAAPTTKARDTPKPRGQRPEATPRRASIAARENAAQTRHSGCRVSPHGGVTWYLPSPPTSSSGFTPPPHTRREAWPRPPGFPRLFIHIHEAGRAAPMRRGGALKPRPLAMNIDEARRGVGGGAGGDWPGAAARGDARGGGAGPDCCSRLSV